MPVKVYLVARYLVIGREETTSLSLFGVGSASVKKWRLVKDIPSSDSVIMGAPSW